MTLNGFSEIQEFIIYGEEFDSWQEIIDSFNVKKVSVKRGAKLVGFIFEDGTEVVWDSVPDLGENNSMIVLTNLMMFKFPKRVEF